MGKFINDYKTLYFSDRASIKWTLIVITIAFIICALVGTYITTIFVKIGILINIFNILFFLIIFKLLQNC